MGSTALQLMMFCVWIATITITTQSGQTNAFSPSSLRTTTPTTTRITTNSESHFTTRSQSNSVVLSASSAGTISTIAKSRNTIKTAASSVAASTAPKTPPLPPPAAASELLSTSNLAVSLDRPLLSPVEFAHRTPASKGAWSSFLAVLLSDVVKTAAVAFVLAAGLTLLPKLIAKLSAKRSGGSANGGIGGVVSSFVSEGVTRIVTPIRTLLSPTPSSSSSSSKTKSQQPKTTAAAYTSPMPFEGDGGWGKCTLRSKRSVLQGGGMGGGTAVDDERFAAYEFALPESHYTIALGLGQELDFCCLSSTDEICTGSFYPYGGSGGGGGKDGKDGGGKAAGVVRIVVPNDKEGEEGSSKFMEVLRNELRPGDEVAIKPGKHHLTYSGKHVPVTDMVYLASGLGIVPVLDQIKATLPRGASSVKTSSVVWLNDDRDTFDLAMDDLEGEYLKYPSKLAVSCILDDVVKNPMEGNKEVEEAVPYFNAGTMAVVCGPKRFAEKAKGYLTRKGYPENCICILP
mmetsp:Transcript_23460/g.49097  ORF Transcript_23460/g.49097 Transcript_23460/m.49097 type:complete len:515 (+) Transcript_23460:141-1685(+)